MPANSRRAPAVRIQIGHRSVSGTGLARSRFGDIFHLCMSMSWPRLLACYGLLFLVINVVFASLFALDPHAVTGQHMPRWLDLLFFSVEVFGTVSFGGLQPDSAYGHALASAEILLGIASFAFMTGLTFARFTRPKAELVFAHHPIITMHEGKLTLITRVANTRHNYLSDVTVKFWVLINEVVEGRQVSRRSYRGNLARDDNPLVILSLLIYHVVDEDSPLHGMDEETLRSRDVGLAYIVSGYDENFAQQVHARHFYHHEDIRWHHAYLDTVHEVSPGKVEVDFSKFHDTRPLDIASDGS
jgi:inward rectifier potassium channel